MIIKAWNALQGKKSYITAGLVIIYALLSVYFGKMTWDQALAWALGSATLVSVKSALGKIQGVIGSTSTPTTPTVTPPTV